MKDEPIFRPITWVIIIVLAILLSSCKEVELEEQRHNTIVKDTIKYSKNYCNSIDFILKATESDIFLCSLLHKDIEFIDGIIYVEYYNSLSFSCLIKITENDTILYTSLKSL